MKRRIRPLTAVPSQPATANVIDISNSPAWLVRFANFLRQFFPGGQSPIDEKFY